MYAIVDIDGNQYVVEKDKEVRIDKLSDVPKNNKLEFDKVLLYRNEKEIMVGTPYVKGCTITADYIKDIKDKKVIVFKFKRRKRSKRTKGHRQIYSVIKINDIKISSK